MAIERMQPDGLSKPAAYTQVVKVGNFIHIAGQTSQNAAGEIVGVGSIEEQAEQVFSNLEVALGSVGATWANVIKVTTFLTRREDLEGYRAARQRHIPNDPPASTLLFISGLAHPDYLIEVEATAVLD